jgi:ubiquitin-protein ligase
MKDYKDIQTNPLTNIKVTCEETNLHNWYCMIHGLTEEEYSNAKKVVMDIIEERKKELEENQTPSKKQLLHG